MPKADSYRPEIDGLRAIAVMAVIANHMNPAYLHSGFLGVDIFFVISGFVVTLSVYDKFQAMPPLAFAVEFFARRARRILPALIAFVLAFSVVAATLESSPRESLETAAFSLIGGSNIYLFSRAIDYFGGRADLNFFTHTWSLGAEEQFYLLFAGIFIAVARFRSLLAVVGGLSALSLACFLYLSYANPAAAHYMLPARLWQMGAGVLAFLVWKHHSAVLGVLRAPAAGLLSLAALLCVLALPESVKVASTIAVVGLTAALLIGLAPGSLAYSALTLRPVRFIGLISYSLYIWHWGVITAARYTIGVNQSTIPWLLAAIFALAAASYFLVEVPFRRHGRSLGAPRTVAIAGTAVAVTALFAVAAPNVVQFSASAAGGPAPLIKAGVETLKDPFVFDGKTSWSGADCVLDSNDQVGKDIPVQRCTLGDLTSAQRRVLVIGNSYSAAELEMFTVLPRNLSVAVTVTSSWGASIAPNLPNKGYWDKANDYYWKTVIPSLLRDFRPGDVVLMVNDLNGMFIPSTYGNAAVLAAASKELSGFAKTLGERGILVGFQHGTPLAREANCTPSMALRKACTFLTRADTLQRRRALDEALVKISQEHRNFRVLDIFDAFCPGEVCSYDDGKVFIYRDEYSHPSVETSRRAQPRLLEFFRDLVRSATIQSPPQ